MDYTERFMRMSDYWYNDGLRKANIRDLSGAIVSLKKSLEFNRENIVARNLLGLVYYGRGEVVEALVEWIISKNFKSYENIANYYIKKVQETPSELEAINQAVHKYNQCLAYCKQNGEDLAIIQLKKIVSTHPNFLKAQQLLALLYLHTEQYSKARQVLKKAHKMDITNEITLRYMHELNQLRSNKVTKLKEEKEQSVTYKLGNETIIQPVSASLKDNAAALTVVNILIGILVGAAVVWYLIVPAMNQKRALNTNKHVIELSEQIATQNTQIETLKLELSEFRDSNTDAENALQNAQNAQESYEALIRVSDQFDAGNTSNADMLAGMLSVNTNILGDQGKAIYKEIADELYPVMCERLYGEASSMLQSGSYGDAIANLEKVIKMNAGYEDGMALKLLGDAYAGNKNADEAKKTYEKVIKDYPDTDAAKAAQDALDGKTE